MNKSIFFLFLQAIKEDRTNAEENYTWIKNYIEGYYWKSSKMQKNIGHQKNVDVMLMYESVGKWFLIL